MRENPTKRWADTDRVQEKQDRRWTSRAGKVVTYRVGEEKPDFPSPSGEGDRQYIRRAKGTGGKADPKGRDARRRRPKKPKSG